MESIQRVGVLNRQNIFDLRCIKVSGPAPTPKKHSHTHSPVTHPSSSRIHFSAGGDECLFDCAEEQRREGGAGTVRRGSRRLKRCRATERERYV